MSVRTSSGRSVWRVTKSVSYRRSRTITCANPNARALSAPALMVIARSALHDDDWYSGAIVTTLAPCSRASVSQCPSGILVAIQFMPHSVMRPAFSAVLRSKSMACWPVTIGWPGGRSVCQEKLSQCRPP